ncbi:MAG: GNAT family N-acetyltransferase [Parachlamydia sp.]|jgi:putative acetyltransferase|nr:GNAT family N-acetyltransferase [Parachlamydia sp.]
MKDQDQNFDGVEVRYTEPSDSKYLKEWLMETTAGRWFPMDDEMEIDDAVMRWIAFYRYKCSLTILKNGLPCGIATLYLQPYRKLAHQCEFGIIVGDGFRGKGIGSYLMNSLIHMAKEKFKIELLHLQVYSENPARKFYRRFGFKEFGEQNSWIKESNENGGQYAGRVFMERMI